jgi:hypothetical protein
MNTFSAGDTDTFSAGDTDTFSAGDTGTFSAGDTGTFSAGDYSDVCFFSKSASTWRKPPVRLGHIEPIAIRYVPLRPWRKCQKS